MSLESILNHILDEAKQQRGQLIQEAVLAKEKIIQEAKQEARELYLEGLNKEKSIYESQRQKLIVRARLESKKDLLGARQELISSIFEKLKSQLHKDEFKKQQISFDKVREVPEDLDFYLKRLKPEYEAEISKIIFR
jgi:vacuolar-type H+-ATPase subunit E/Vma4